MYLQAKQSQYLCFGSPKLKNINLLMYELYITLHNFVIMTVVN